ncbi:MAG: DNA repair protein RecN [Elusimicrobia bacterium]|nr:DNA repair protein RecN [Elusimicrobiota bacterium]
MLSKLSVRNFAVVEALDLELGAGLTAFTGETGAGKSILVEALGFLAGGRGSTDWLRAGAPRLEVSGVFSDGRRAVTASRTLDADGRSRVLVDGKPATVSALARLTEGLVDFHGQHEHQTLARPAAQLELLDGFAGLADERVRMAEAWARRKELTEALASLQMSEEERQRRLDLLRFQVSELEAADPKPGEEEALEAELPRLKHAARLGELAGEAYGRLYESEGSAEEQLGAAGRALEEMARLDPSLDAAREALERAREAASEAARALSRYTDGEGADPERLDAVLSRLDLLAKLKRKYGATVEELAARRGTLSAELERLENHGERAGEVEKDLAAAEKAAAARAEALRKARLKAAKRLSERAQSELAGLGLERARLSVSVELDEEALGPTGFDRVEFLLAANPGEPLKALRAVASGGELSRVMLALKTVLAEADRVGTLVFDEVDAGVGGAVGAAVGERLAALGRRRQVLVVTHLPQVACRAAVHFEVAKAVRGGRTYARVGRLEGGARVETLARMLGGREVTAASRRHAQELLETA